MNKIFQLVWNHLKRTWVAAGETAKRNAKGRYAVAGVLGREGGVDQLTQSVSKNTQAFGLSCLTVALAMAQSGVIYASTPAPTTLPTGAEIVAGQANIVQTNNTLTVQQHSNKLITNWTSFDIGEQATVNFQQPGAESVALNRIGAQNPTQILGKLNANGQVFLLNPAGIIIGKGAQLNVNTLLASTLNMKDEDFLKGNYLLDGKTSVGDSVINKGTITAAEGGRVIMIAPVVQNQGTINTPSGTTALAAAKAVKLDLTGTGVGIRIDEGALNALVDNAQLIQAHDGRVILTARGLDAVAKAAINNTGVIEATSLTSRGGKITLEADAIKLGADSRLDASGKLGGGEVLVGGDWQGAEGTYQAQTVTMEAGAEIHADATERGDGGKVVLWSDVHNKAAVTKVHGEITARGGALGGDGGEIETSGHKLDTTGVRGDASASAGRGGLWLFDPYNITITTNASSNGGFDGDDPETWVPTNNSNIRASDIEAMLNAGTSVMITTTGAGTAAGQIVVSAAINKTSGGDATLTLRADGRLNVSANVTSTSGKLNLVLWSDYNNTNNGGISVTQQLTTNGGHLWMGGSSTAGGSTTWNGLLVGDGASVGAASANFNSFDLYGTINTGGGHVFAWAGDGYSTGGGNSGFYTNNTGTITTEGGNVTLRASVFGGSLEIIRAGHVVIESHDDSFSSALTVGEDTGIHFTDSLGGLTLGKSSNTANLTLESDSGTLLTSGNIQLYGGTLTVNDDLIASGNIRLFARDHIALAADLTLSGDNGVLLSARHDTGDGGNIVANGALSITSQTGDITLDGGENGSSTESGDASVVMRVVAGNVNLTSGSGAVNLHLDEIQHDQTNASDSALYINTKGGIRLQSYGASFVNDFNDERLFINNGLSQRASGLVIGKSTNSVNVSLTRAVGVAGNVAITGGNIVFSERFSSSGEVSLQATGTVTDSGSGYLEAAGLLVKDATSVTLDAEDTDLDTLAAKDVGTIAVADKDGLEIGAVAGVSGINATGLIDVQSLVGDIVLSAKVATTSADSNAIIINAGSRAAAKTSAGGNIRVSGGGSVSTGAGGIVKLYSGTPYGSTGLQAFVGAQNSRYNSDENQANYRDPLVAGNRYAIFRGQPGLGAVGVNTSGLSSAGLPTGIVTLEGIGGFVPNNLPNANIGGVVETNLVSDNVARGQQVRANSVGRKLTNDSANYRKMLESTINQSTTAHDEGVVLNLAALGMHDNSQFSNLLKEVNIVEQSSSGFGLGSTMTFMYYNDSMAATFMKAGGIADRVPEMTEMQVTNFEYELNDGSAHLISVGLSNSGVMAIAMPAAVRQQMPLENMLLLGMAMANQDLDVDFDTLETLVVRVGR